METKNIKSRGNWNLPFCIKSDCKNRDEKVIIPGASIPDGKNEILLPTIIRSGCEDCIKFSNYEREDKNE